MPAACLVCKPAVLCPGQVNLSQFRLAWELINPRWGLLARHCIFSKLVFVVSCMAKIRSQFSFVYGLRKNSLGSKARLQAHDVFEHELLNVSRCVHTQLARQK